MPTMDQVDPAITYSLFKGEPGTRKSTVALTYPKPQYWFSFDQKMESLGIPMRNFRIDPKDIEFDDYKDWNAAKAKLESLQVNPLMKDKRKIATLIVDSITSMGDATNQQTLQTKGMARKSGDGEQGKVIAGIAVNSVEDYNAEMAVFQELIALTKDIHKHYAINVILIGHILQTEQKSLDGKTHFSRTLVTGGKKAAAKIPAYCTEIYHFNIKMGLNASSGGQYELFTVHTGDDFARTALPLNEEIIFGNDNFYDRYIIPAVKKMKGEVSMLSA